MSCIYFAEVISEPINKCLDIEALKVAFGGDVPKLRREIKLYILGKREQLSTSDANGPDLTGPFIDIFEDSL